MQELRFVGSNRVYMSTVYDNWERLTAAVIRREELWQLFHASSRNSSISSIESDFGTSSRWGPSSRLEFSSYLPSAIKSIGFIRVDKGNSDILYIENSSPSFDLEDLLEASWEFIGDDWPTFSTTFAATLSNGTAIVLKKLKIGRVANEVFDERMATVRSIDNENVASLWGYFFVEDGVWGLYDYFSQGSVSAMLHGERGGNRVHLDWETRIRIAVGAARGLAYIHTQCGGKLVHGNMKALNIFLNSQQYGCVADYDLGSLINPSTKPLNRNSGYRAPEVYGNKPSQASDVYSFGILLLELLTGRSPKHMSRAHKSFGDWAHLHAQDGLSFLVYDVQLLRNPIVKQAMWNMLEIAMPCLAKKPENRPKMSDVVEILELILVP